VILFIFLFLTAAPALAADVPPFDVVIFTRQGCPHCAAIKAELENLKANTYHQMTITEYDLVLQPDKLSKYIEFANAYNLYDAELPVPMTYIGDKGIKGQFENEVADAVQACTIKACVKPDDFVAQYLKDHPVTQPVTSSGSKSIIGWIVIGVIVVGGVVIFINKS
jgi:glutaredoxin